VHAIKVRYPQYLYGLLSAARTAQAVGEKRFTAMEFGVTGGNGLVAMEKHAEVVEQKWDVTIDVVGDEQCNRFVLRLSRSLRCEGNAGGGFI
jgi:hypothetical protein